MFVPNSRETTKWKIHFVGKIVTIDATNSRYCEFEVQLKLFVWEIVMAI